VLDTSGEWVGPLRAVAGERSGLAGAKRAVHDADRQDRVEISTEGRRLQLETQLRDAVRKELRSLADRAPGAGGRGR